MLGRKLSHKENGGEEVGKEQGVIDLACDVEVISDEMWVTDLNLSYHDRNVLQSQTEWINDNIIYVAQLLLKQMSEDDDIIGWQSTQLCKTKQLFTPLPPCSRFIQILHVNRNHWVTVSNISKGESCHDSIFLYDSLCPGTVSMDIKKQVCSFMKTRRRTLRFEIMNIQMQENLNDCGLYAIAHATELTYKRDPCKASFKGSEMRDHLMQCFEKKELTPFPLKKERRIGFSGRIRKSIPEPIYCYCRMPNYYKRMTMVCCNTCSEWFHMKCIGDCDVSNNPKVKWFCVDCAKLL